MGTDSGLRRVAVSSEEHAIPLNTNTQIRGTAHAKPVPPSSFPSDPYDMHAVSHGTREALKNYPKVQGFQ